MVLTEKTTGLTLEKITSGFLGLPVLYVLWNGNKFIASSTDRKNWKMGTWVSKQDFSDFDKTFPLTSIKK